MPTARPLKGAALRLHPLSGSADSLGGCRQGGAELVGYRLELDRGAGHVLQQLVRGRLLAERPELAQERAGLAAPEPVAAELLAQEGRELCFERPRAQVRSDVVARVDVGEIVRLARLDLER